jgi:hypothetical protein
LWLPGSTPPATKSLFGDGIDIPAGFCHPFLNAIVAPDPFRHVFGPCGPRPTGVAEKRFLINALKYDAEATWIELEGAAATFGTKEGGKRVKLDKGRLTCLAAPQQRALRVETPHGVASVIGTRFSMNVSSVKTDLSVLEGKVQCERAGQTVTVGPGQTAEASAQGLSIVSLPSEPRPGLAYEFFGLFGNAELALHRESGSTPDIGPTVGHVDRGHDWGLRFTGLLMPPADGNYVFRAEADSGVRVTIDGKRVIDGWAHDGARTGRATLSKAAPAPIVVEYFFIPAAAVTKPEMRPFGGTTPTLRLFWTPPGGQEEPVPAAAYAHTPGVHTAFATLKDESR